MALKSPSCSPITSLNKKLADVVPEIRYSTSDLYGTGGDMTPDKPDDVAAAEAWCSKFDADVDQLLSDELSAVLDSEYPADDCLSSEEMSPGGLAMLSEARREHLEGCSFCRLMVHMSELPTGSEVDRIAQGLVRLADESLEFLPESEDEMRAQSAARAMTATLNPEAALVYALALRSEVRHFGLQDLLFAALGIRRGRAATYTRLEERFGLSVALHAGVDANSRYSTEQLTSECDQMIQSFLKRSTKAALNVARR